MGARLIPWRASRSPGSGSRATAQPSSRLYADRRVGGREDSVWKRGKAAREPVFVTSLSEQAQKQRRTRGGAKGADPGERPPGQKRLPRVQSGCLEQRGFVPSVPRRAELSD